MKTQIVYALIATPNDTFLQECWASVYSLRLYDREREVRVCCDEATAEYIKSFPDFCGLVTEIIKVNVPVQYSAKERSRVIKTSIRQLIGGNYLFVDTDTIFAGTLEYIDTLDCDVAAVPEFHVPLSKSIFRDGVIDNVKNIFGTDVSNETYWFNSGVMYVADSQKAYDFYRRWHDNWKYSAFKKGNSQDQPALMKTNHDLGSMIQELPGIFNCQFAFSVKHYAEAKIIHYLHFRLLPHPQNPFYNKSIYNRIKEDGCISEETAKVIKNCKSALSETSAIIDGDTINFLMSNPGHVFLRTASEGGFLNWLMNKIAGFYSRWYRFIDKRH